ncbi:immunoglobulin I-set domain protein [Salana multivorans]|uniref:Immunoglobulin I-set domain protein n=1 Tax=Salana multivorans TaxID=120377 RepID=A0A3N2D738_9MICO|nr:immunoglobulin domain-containing protein [Salana multivorans]ROR95562.1 immunoglobulin I-set domain protein [Salana multivorans]
MTPHPGQPATRPFAKLPTTRSATALRSTIGMLLALVVLVAGAPVALAAPDGVAITRQPLAVTVTAGDDAVLDVVAADAAGYRWQVLADGEDVAAADETAWHDVDAAANPSALTAELTLPAADAAAQGTYRVQVAGADGTVVTSEPALLTVTPAEETPAELVPAEEVAAEDPGTAAPPAPAESAETDEAAPTPAAAPAPSSGEGRVSTLAAGLVVTSHPSDVSVATGAQAQFRAAATGGVGQARIQWQRSASLSASGPPAGDRWVDLAGENRATLTVTAGATPHQGNRWYRAVFTDDAGATVATDPAKLTIAAKPTITAHPVGQTVRVGEDATFTVTATSETPAVTRWESTRTALPNGEPDDSTWAAVDGATQATLVVPDVRPGDHGTFYRVVVTSDAGSTTSYPAQLRVTERLDTRGSVTVTGESYGPEGTTPTPFSVSAPNAVVAGQPIVIEGRSYVHPDGAQGSVAMFMIDASYSGDPSTLLSTRDIVHPVTGEVFADKRSHALVQANADGTFRVEIPWPDETNTTRDAEFFATSWAPGTQHMVRILTGSQLAGDYQRGITVRFTVVGSATDPATAPVVTVQPADASVTAGETATFTAAASGTPAPSVRWESSQPGGPWVELAGATTETLTLTDLTTARSGTRYRAVFTNSAGTATSEAATLRVAASGIAITTQPTDQSVEAGETARFTATAAGAEITTQWERSRDGVTWETIRGATASVYPLGPVVADDAEWRYRARFTNPGTTEGVVTDPASLTVTARANVREYCGLSYGPAGHAGEPFCFTGPERVVVGEDIVIRGTRGYLATDGRTGSVVNFFLDALYSGDPSTVYVKRPVTNPITGKPVDDRRTHAMVQAASDGTWTATIPWPTLATVSPASDGGASFTRAELDARFAPGTTHAVRMLSGSLLSSPADVQRGSTLLFTVVEDLADPIPVTEPVYPHETYHSAVAGDHATAWVPSTADSGLPVQLTGTGWLTKDRAAGSVVDVRLLDSDGTPYRRAGTADDPHDDPADPTIWQRVHVRADGVLDASLDLPAEVTAGSYVAVRLTTRDDGTALGDVAREWTSRPLTVDGTPWTAPVTEGCTATPAEATYQLAPGMAVPAANVGGTIRLTGEKWCNTVTGKGSYIAIKINDGAFSHKGSGSARVFNAELGEETGLCAAGICRTNKTIWYVIEAADDGSFDVQVPLPDRTSSTPAFGEGAYTLRIMTATLAGDPYYGGVREASRTMQTPEFTVVCETCDTSNATPGEPTLAPDPPHATQDLTQATRGGVSVTQEATRWLVTVPAAAPGDWVYANVYDEMSPRFPWGARWFQVDATGRIALPLAGVTLPVGTNRLSVQDRTGALLGWTTVTVLAPETAPPPVTQQPVDGAGKASSGALTRPRTTIRTAPQVLGAAQPRPADPAPAPVGAYTDLDDTNVGDVTAVETEDGLVVTLPGVPGGAWVFLHLYTEDGRVIPVDWVQVGADHTFTVRLGTLPDGLHRLTITDATGTLVGWLAVNGPQPLAAAAEAERTDDQADPDPVAALTAGTPGAVAGAQDPTPTLILVGLALLVLAGAGAAAITLRGPAPTTKPA